MRKQVTSKEKIFKMKTYSHIVFLAALLLTVGPSVAQQPFRVSVQADYSKAVKLYHDEPLLLIVTLMNPAAQDQHNWNMAADRRLNKLEQMIKEGSISREQFEKEKMLVLQGKKNVPAVHIGKAGQPWRTLVKWKMVKEATTTEMRVPVTLLQLPSTDDTAVLDENGYYAAYFGIDPDQIKQIPAATYVLTATVENETSEPVRIEIQNPDMPSGVAVSERMLLKTGQYHWHKGDGVKTKEYADRILAINPNSLDGLALKGDGQLLQKEYLPAMESYKKAIQEYYRQYGANSEPPEYLFGMMEFIKKETGQN